MNGTVQPITPVPGASQQPDDGQDGQTMRNTLDAAYARLREHADAIVGCVASIRDLESWKRESSERIGLLEAGQRSSESAQARLSGAIEGLLAAQDALRLAISDISATTHSTHDQLSELAASWARHMHDDVSSHAKLMKFLIRIAWPIGVIAAAILGAVAYMHGGK